MQPDNQPRSRTGWKRIVGGTVTALVLLSVPVLAITVLGLWPSAALFAGSPSADANFTTEAPAAAMAKADDQGETRLKNWTYTRHPYSGFHR